MIIAATDTGCRQGELRAPCAGQMVDFHATDRRSCARAWELPFNRRFKPASHDYRRCGIAAYSRFAQEHQAEYRVCLAQSSRSATICPN
jgi:hypothetical protein